MDTRNTATNFIGWVAQVVEQKTENLRVGGANTLSATNCDNEVKWYARAYAGSMDKLFLKHRMNKVPDTEVEAVQSIYGPIVQR